MTRKLAGLFGVAAAGLALAAPGSAAKPEPGNWFWLDDEAETYISSVQFNVPTNGKSLKGITIYWYCGNDTKAHKFSNPPYPTFINGKDKFKLVGATEPPPGKNTKNFTFKGTFKSKTEAKFSIKMEGCGSKTKGTITAEPD